MKLLTYTLASRFLFASHIIFPVTLHFDIMLKEKSELGIKEWINKKLKSQAATNYICYFLPFLGEIKRENE